MPHRHYSIAERVNPSSLLLQVVRAVADLLKYRESRLCMGIPLADQYNSMRDPGQNPLRDLHATLDAAVFNAYAFSADDDLLAQLLALNLAIAGAVAEDGIPPRPPGPVGLRGTRATQFAVEFDL